MSKLTQNTANQLYNKYVDLGGKQSFKNWLHSEVIIWKKSNDNFIDFPEWEAKRLNAKMVKMNKVYRADNDSPIVDEFEGTEKGHKKEGFKKTYVLGLTAMELTLLGIALFAVGYTIYSNITARRQANHTPQPQPAPQPAPAPQPVQTQI